MQPAELLATPARAPARANHNQPSSPQVASLSKTATTLRFEPASPNPPPRCSLGLAPPARAAAPRRAVALPRRLEAKGDSAQAARPPGASAAIAIGAAPPPPRFARWLSSRRIAAACLATSARSSVTTSQTRSRAAVQPRYHAYMQPRSRATAQTRSRADAAAQPRDRSDTQPRSRANTQPHSRATAQTQPCYRADADPADPALRLSCSAALAHAFLSQA